MYSVYPSLLVLVLLLPPFLSGHWHIVGFVYIIICVLSSDERLLVVHTELSPAELYTPLSAGRGQHDLHKRLVIRALLRVCVQGTQNGDCLVVLILRHELSIHLKSVVGIAAIFRTSLSCYLTDILTLPLLTTPLSLFRFPSLCQQECFAFFLCVHSSSPNRKNKLMDSMSVYMHVTRWTQAPIIVNFNSQHRTALWSERKLLEQ